MMVCPRSKDDLEYGCGMSRGVMFLVCRSQSFKPPRTSSKQRYLETSLASW